MAEKTNQPKPHIVMTEPVEGPICFTMTRFAPLVDSFSFYNNDHLVIIDPPDVLWEAPIVPRSTKTLEDHITYIQENLIKKALVIAEDISFLRHCPSLECLQIIPPYSAASFDYAPLYDLPCLRQLNCHTIYGPKDSLSTFVDYSRISGLEDLHVCGKKGHVNLQDVKGLHTLSCAQGQPVSGTLADLDVSQLRELDLLQSPLRTLAGLENAKSLHKLCLTSCRRLEDLSALASIGDSLTLLSIESCGKIPDFSVLHELHELEHLRLYGSNTLPDLSFLNNMPNLQTFTFTMDVLDGDLTPCLSIPYASCRNRKHFNLKDSQLPKNLGQK